ncbi:MAG: hypothetical protein ACK5M7_02200 [Draconibacterium sp.]
MFPTISIIKNPKQDCSTATLFENKEQLNSFNLNPNEKEYLSQKFEKETECSLLNYPELKFFGKIKPSENYLIREAARKAGAKLFHELKSAQINSVCLVNKCSSPLLQDFLEGLFLTSYSFNKYLKEKETFVLAEIFVVEDNVSEPDVEELLNLVRAVFAARDLVNEPNSFLSAPQLSKELEKLSDIAGFTLDVFNKQKLNH